jgi:transposase
VRVHQCATNPKGGAAAQAMGKTRGGRNTKIMALTDVRGLPVKLSLIEGQAYEGNHVIELLDDPRGLMVVGDKGFDSDKLRQQLEELGARHCFPSKSNRRKKRRLNKKLYRQRYQVENFFCRLKRWACSSTRRNKLALNFLSLYLRTPCLRSRRLVSVMDRDLGLPVNRKHLQRLPRKMGLEAIYCKPRLIHSHVRPREDRLHRISRGPHQVPKCAFWRTTSF